VLGHVKVRNSAVAGAISQRNQAFVFLSINVAMENHLCRSTMQSMQSMQQINITELSGRSGRYDENPVVAIEVWTEI